MHFMNDDLTVWIGACVIVVELIINAFNLSISIFFSLAILIILIIFNIRNNLVQLLRESIELNNFLGKGRCVNKSIPNPCFRPYLFI